MVAREGGLAWVQTNRRSACSACGHGAGCATSVLGRLLSPGAANRLAVEDGLGVRVGDRVVIGIPDGLLVRASLAAYLLPLAALVAAAAIAEWLRAPELAVAAAGDRWPRCGTLADRAPHGGQSSREHRYRPVLLRRERPTVRVPFETGATAAAMPQQVQTQTQQTTEVNP